MREPKIHLARAKGWNPKQTKTTTACGNLVALDRATRDVRDVTCSACHRTRAFWDAADEAKDAALADRDEGSPPAAARLRDASREPFRLEFVLHGLPTIERNRNRHWRTVRDEETAWKRAVFFAVGEKVPPEPLEAARVICVRHSAVEPDPDGLHDSFKPIIDAIRLGKRRDGLPILVDDRPANFVAGSPEYFWEEAPRGHGKVTVIVEEIPDAEASRPNAPRSRNEEDRGS